MSDKERIKQTLKRNEERLYVFPFDGLQEEWRQRKLGSVKTAAGLVAPARDAVTAYRICKELGIMGRVAFTTLADGRGIVIVKGYPGLRMVLTGTRYLARNAKIVKLAIGRIGIATSMTEGAVLTIVLYVGIDVLEYILNEHETLSMLSATLATDLLKVGISAIAGAAAGLAIAGFTTVAIGPLVAVIFVGTIVGWGLEMLDSQFGVTDKLADAIDAYAQVLVEKHEAMQKAINSAPHKIERGIIWRMYGWDIDNPRGF